MAANAFEILMILIHGRQCI